MSSALRLSPASLPGLALAPCVRAWLVRSTVYSPSLPPAQRLDRFPATPFCAITWMIEGDAMLVEPATGENAAPVTRSFPAAHTALHDCRSRPRTHDNCAVLHRRAASASRGEVLVFRRCSAHLLSHPQENIVKL